eukprot:6203822-Pleurochrysis_carterae.AAC.4
MNTFDYARYYSPPAFDYSKSICYIPPRMASMVHGHEVLTPARKLPQQHAPLADFIIAKATPTLASTRKIHLRPRPFGVRPRVWAVHPRASAGLARASAGLAHAAVGLARLP